jgi:hypothetical protein
VVTDAIGVNVQRLLKAIFTRLALNVTPLLGLPADFIKRSL